jgi:hypothetical protein
MKHNHAAQAIHAAIADLLSAIAAKGYADPYVKLDFDLGQSWKFWLSLGTDKTVSSSAVIEQLYGADLDDILSRAAHWIEELPIDGREAMTKAMAPWFEIEQGAAA